LYPRASPGGFEAPLLEAQEENVDGQENDQEDLEEEEEEDEEDEEVDPDAPSNAGPVPREENQGDDYGDEEEGETLDSLMENFFTDDCKCATRWELRIIVSRLWFPEKPCVRTY